VIDFAFFSNLNKKIVGIFPNSLIFRFLKKVCQGKRRFLLLENFLQSVFRVSFQPLIEIIPVCEEEKGPSSLCKSDN